MSHTIAVVGAGSWGAALAQACVRAGHDVFLIGRDSAAANEINTHHTLSAYLGDIPLDPSLTAHTDFDPITKAEIVLMVVPAQATRQTLAAIGADRLAGKPVILCAKGFEAGGNRRQSEILAELAPQAEPMVLSGPSFARDVAAGRPTAVTLAGRDIGAAEAMAGVLHSASFRPYASDDIVGVELAGGLKNVYALGSGAIDGAGLGLSARSAFLARAFAELGRLIGALGGTEATLGGLAGIGDLALSCTSNASRNYAFGMALGEGGTVDAIRASGLGLAEGVYTAPVAHAMAKAKGIDAPLIGAVNHLLAGDTPIGAIVETLMARPLKREG